MGMVAEIADTLPVSGRVSAFLRWQTGVSRQPDGMRLQDVIQKNWQELIKPNKLDIQPGDDPQRVATVVAEPLERGFGLTLGNALRRVLLSSLQGAAVTSIQIEGVLHEFSSIPGVREDVTDIVLNIKTMGLRLHGDGPKRMRLRAEGPGEVTASMIETGPDIEVMDPELVICTLDNSARLVMELTVENGKGYVPASQNRPEDAPIGLIPVDALFAPIRKVSYKVDNTRVGQVTDYDRLSMQLETNGAVSPEDAVALPPVSFRTSFSSSSTSKSRPMRSPRSGAKSRRSTRTFCARWTSWNCRSGRPTA